MNAFGTKIIKMMDLHMAGDISQHLRDYIVKFRVIETQENEVPICLAIINDEEGLPKSLGKKRLRECKRPMRRLDEYTLECPVGHKARTIKWEMRSFAFFYSDLNINGLS